MTRLNSALESEDRPRLWRYSAAGDAHDWFNPGIAQKLAKTNRVIAIDMRGHGETGPSPADSKGTMIQDIVDFMDYLRIDQACIGGYSMGGATTAGLLKVARNALSRRRS